jgi:CubicO group peptidase (beta-lactamase class C family)
LEALLKLAAPFLPLVALTLVFQAALAGEEAKAPVLGISSNNIDALDAWIRAQMAYRGLPGLAVGVIHQGRLTWAKGYGFADAERKIPVTPATLFQAASITKTFTATAIMQLRDAGKLALDDPVAKHLPWFELKNPAKDAPAITIRHLLTHTAGLPREAAFPYWTDAAFPTLEQVKAALPGQEAVFEFRPDGNVKRVKFGQNYLDRVP